MSASNPARILIAEDNPEGAELLEAYLDGADYDIEIARDGDDALKKVQSFRPDLILLDVMMPKISGFEVCKRLKAKPETQGIIIHMITALDQHHDIDRAVEVGTNDFLTKPINKTELLLRIKSALASRQHTDPLTQTLAYIEGVQSAV